MASALSGCKATTCWRLSAASAVAARLEQHSPEGQQGLGIGGLQPQRLGQAASARGRSCAA